MPRNRLCLLSEVPNRKTILVTADRKKEELCKDKIVSNSIMWRRPVNSNLQNFQGTLFGLEQGSGINIYKFN